jgi:formate dehydrogenase subunit delta
VSTGHIEKLARMANQIGDFFAVMPDAAGAGGAATHLKKFWTPKMIGELIGQADAGAVRLNPTASRAIDILRGEASGQSGAVGVD